MAEPLSLLNVFEVDDDDRGRRHLVAMIDAVRAGSEGLSPSVIVGELRPPEGVSVEEFTADDFHLNPTFIESLTLFMNQIAIEADDLKVQARSIATGWLYVIDSRAEDSENDPEPENIIGAFAVDEASQIVPGSFQYNEKHRLFDDRHGMSSVLVNREFFDWLNPKF